MIRTRFLALPLILALAAPADAGWFRHRRACRPRPRYAAPAPCLTSRSLPPPPGAYTTPRGGLEARQDFKHWFGEQSALAWFT